MNAELLNINDFIQKSKSELIIDVRSPVEFEKGHIVNAINIPLFENTERAEIGTLFKEQGKDVAVAKGLEFVSPKMTHFVDRVKSLSSNKMVYVYCFRGGMRSNSFAWLMNTAGLKAFVLKGGYKAYRNFVLNDFALKRNFILIGGKTGSGKTGVLRELGNYHQIIDLEKLANHKGSAFGSINEDKQNPQQVFENTLYSQLNSIDNSRPVILEDESQAIGYNRIPYALWLQMKQAPIIKLDIPLELRIPKLVEDYATVNKNQLKQAVLKIAQQLGPLNTKLCLLHIDAEQLADVARLCLLYYDKAYDYLYENKKQPIISIQSDTMDPMINAKKILPLIDSITF